VSSSSQLPDTKGFLSLRSLSGSTAGSVLAANPNAVRFSVPIATLNDAAEIDLFMTHLSAADIPPNNFEVIVVEDGSSGGAAGWVPALGKLKVAEAPVCLDRSLMPLSEPISQRWLFRNIR
jgi:hypothetical protein